MPRRIRQTRKVVIKVIMCDVRNLMVRFSYVFKFSWVVESPPPPQVEIFWRREGGGVLNFIIEAIKKFRKI